MFVRYSNYHSACEWYGNYGHNGHNGQFYGRIVDYVDTMVAIAPCGQ